MTGNFTKDILAMMALPVPLRATDGVVMSSALRLKRNLSDEPMPGWCKAEDRQRIRQRLQHECADIRELQGGLDVEMTELTVREKKFFIERGAITRLLGARDVGNGVMMNKSGQLAAMFNEADHLCLHSWSYLLDLNKQWRVLSKIDTALEQKLPYAFHNKWGYLSHNVEKCGTGLEASVIVHLPGLGRGEFIPSVAEAAKALALGFDVIYEDVPTCYGDFLRVSTLDVMGVTETATIDKLVKFVNHLVRQEWKARGLLATQQEGTWDDLVADALNLIHVAKEAPLDDALRCISMLRTAASMKASVPIIQGGLQESIFFKTITPNVHTAHLQYLTGEDAPTPEAVASLRARYMKSQFGTSPSKKRKGRKDHVRT